MLSDSNLLKLANCLILQLAAALLLCLSACSTTLQPSQSIIVEALKLQIGLTQSAIASTLNLEPVEDPEVSRVRLVDQEEIQLGQSRAIRLTGRFDWRLPGDRVCVDSLFEIVLERGLKEQSWHLAQPAGSADGLDQDWITYPLGLDNSP